MGLKAYGQSKIGHCERETSKQKQLPSFGAPLHRRAVDLGPGETTGC
jgi:hypothetical protein